MQSGFSANQGRPSPRSAGIPGTQVRFPPGSISRHVVSVALQTAPARRKNHADCPIDGHVQRVLPGSGVLWVSSSMQTTACDRAGPAQLAANRTPLTAPTISQVDHGRRPVVRTRLELAPLARTSSRWSHGRGDGSVGLGGESSCWVGRRLRPGRMAARARHPGAKTEPRSGWELVVGYGCARRALLGPVRSGNRHTSRRRDLGAKQRRLELTRTSRHQGKARTGWTRVTGAAEG